MGRKQDIYFCPTSNSEGYESPREKVYSRKVNIKKEVEEQYQSFLPVIGMALDIIIVWIQ